MTALICILIVFAIYCVIQTGRTCAIKPERYDEITRHLRDRD
jgi:hypothetical protein